MTTTQNAALPQIHRLFDAINDRDLTVITDLVTDDSVDHGSPVPLRSTGLQAPGSPTS